MLDADFTSLLSAQPVSMPSGDPRIAAGISIAIMAASLLVFLLLLLMPPESDMVAFLFRAMAALFVAGVFQAAFMSMLWKLPLKRTLLIVPAVKVLSAIAVATLFASFLDNAMFFYIAPLILESAVAGTIFRRSANRPATLFLLPVLVVAVDAQILLL